MKSSHVTIRDVAKQAGVSYQTVSRVINGSERVNPETKARVDAAITELGYRPNAIARFMSKGTSRTLACISPNLTDYTFASLIEGAEKEARQLGYFFISASAPDVAAFSLLMDELIASRLTEGIMIINPFIDDRYSLIPPKVPTVLLGTRPLLDNMNAVALDEKAAGQFATQHLIDLGHRSIALISGPMIEDCSQDRSTGYEQTLAKAGIRSDKNLVFEGDWSATSGYQAVQQFLANSLHFSAIFAQNDRMAVGAIRALHKAKLRVPQDVSVIGFDDMPLASYFDPPLTTIRQDTFAMGREAARLLIQALEHPETPNSHLLVPVELIVRESTAPHP